MREKGVKGNEADEGILGFCVYYHAEYAGYVPPRIQEMEGKVMNRLSCFTIPTVKTLMNCL